MRHVLPAIKQRVRVRNERVDVHQDLAFGGADTLRQLMMLLHSFFEAKRIAGPTSKLPG
jgi:hypothetical protein